MSDSPRRATSADIVRVALTVVILIASAVLAFTLRPSFETPSVTPNIVLVAVDLVGEDAQLDSVAFTPGDSGGTILSVTARGTQSLQATIRGPASGDVGGEQWIAEKVGPIPPCRATVGSCELLSALDGNEPIFLLDTEYEARGAEVEGSPGVFRFTVEIPRWRGTGYVSAETSGRIEIALPTIAVSGGAVAPDDRRAQVTVDLSRHDMLTTAGWTSAPAPTFGLPGELIWTLPADDGIISRVRASGVIPSEVDQIEWKNFLSGILIGVAAAAALALVGEIGRQREPAPVSAPPQPPQPPQPQRTSPALRTHRAGRIRFQRPRNHQAQPQPSKHPIPVDSTQKSSSFGTFRATIARALGAIRPRR